jgi:hypothetical protein
MAPQGSILRFLIYRKGSGTPMSMTPRKQDVDGLSASKFAPSRGDNYQIIDTSKFRQLRAFCNNEATGHVYIVDRITQRRPGCQVE